MSAEQQRPVIERMQPYDGDGWICYVPNGKGIGYGPTKTAALRSWKNGDSLAADALKKWSHLL